MRLRNKARALAPVRCVPHFFNQTYLGILALSDVLLDRVVPVLGVTFVDGEDLPSLGNLHVWVCENKLTNGLGR